MPRTPRPARAGIPVEPPAAGWADPGPVASAAVAERAGHVHVLLTRERATGSWRRTDGRRPGAGAMPGSGPEGGLVETVGFRCCRGCLQRSRGAAPEPPPAAGPVDGDSGRHGG